MSGSRFRRAWLTWAIVLALAAAPAIGCGRPRANFPDAPSVQRAPSSQEAPVRVLKARYEYRFDEQGNWSQAFSQQYRILNRQGVESWGSTGAGWSPWYMDRPVLRARVTDPDGTVRELDPTTIAESAAYPDLPHVYSDRRLLRAPLPGLRVGSVVSESAFWKTKRPFFVGGSGFQIPFQSNIPRDSIEVVIDLPEALPFNLELLDLKITPSETRQNGRRRIVFKGGPYEAIDGIDYYAPPSLPAWPSLAFSTASSWQQVASAYADLVETKLDADLSGLARKSVTDRDTPLETASKLLAEVRRRVRYTSVQFGQAAIVPAKPSETLSRAYGDCKDQALLLAGMLRAVGVPAKLALLLTGPGQDVRPRLPSLDAFDHAIVVVPGESPIWIDPTASYARAGDLPEADQGRLALIVDRDTTELTMTPVGTAKNNTYLEIRELKLSEFGPATVRETSTATGLIEQRLRSGFTGSKDALTKSLGEYAKKTYNAAKLSESKYPDPEALEVPFEVELEVGGAKVGQSDLISASALTDHKVLFSWLPDVVFGDEPRSVDLILPVPYRAEVRYRITPPKHFVVQRVPGVSNLSMGPLRLTRGYEKNADGGVEARFAVECDKRQWNPADIEAFRKAVKELQAEAEELVEFEHVAQQAIEARQTTKGIAIYRELSEKEPKSSIALLRWALNLTDVGFGQVAREKARAAVALAPDSAVAHRSLAIILEHDEFGRHMYPGYDRAGALAAYERAVALDAEDVYSKVQRALLLEYDGDGRRYRDAAELAKAVAAYDAIPASELEAYDQGAMRDNALYALFYAERFDELRKRFAQRKPTQTPPPLALAVAAVDASPMAAISEADRLGLRGEERSEHFAAAAASLYTLARYREAAGLFDVAAGDSKQSAAYANRARLLHGLTRTDLERLKHDTPEALIKKVQMLIMSAETRDDARLDAFRSSRSAPGMLSALWSETSESVSKVDLPRRVLVDVAAGIFKTRLEGDDAGGYRVRLTASAPGSLDTTSDYYVVREAGRYLIRAVQGGAEVGCEALHWAEKKKDAVARRWLGWAKDDMTSAAGDDALRVTPFVRLWADGKGQPLLAAAALCASGTAYKRALELLVGARGTPGVDDVAIDHAITIAASRSEDYKTVLEAAERLGRVHPDSKVLRGIQLGALWSLERFDDFEKTVKKALEKAKSPGPERTELLHRLASVQSQTGRIAESRKTCQTIIDERQAGSGTYNSAAWSGLFISPLPKDILDQALQAAQISGFRSYAELHTLASVYVELGKFEEARQTLVKLMELEGKGNPPREPTWYVIGAMAEAYGLTATARSAYQKLQPPKGKSPTSTYWLAKKRLSALDKKGR